MSTSQNSGNARPRSAAPPPDNRERKERVSAMKFDRAGHALLPSRTPARNETFFFKNPLFHTTQTIDSIESYTQMGTPNELHSNCQKHRIEPRSNPGRTHPVRLLQPANRLCRPVPATTFLFAPIIRFLASIPLKSNDLLPIRGLRNKLGTNFRPRQHPSPFRQPKIATTHRPPHFRLADPPSPPWTRFLVPASQCPRIPAVFLAHERLMLGDDMFRQFITSGGFLSSRELIESAIDPSIKPLFPGSVFSNLTWSDS